MRLKVGALLLVFSGYAATAPLTAQSTGYEWRKASRTERLALAQDAVRRINATYGARDMVACLNEFYADPVDPNIHRQSLLDIMTACHAMLR